MADLVERLQERASIHNAGSRVRFVYLPEDRHLDNEAADLITRLRAENKELQQSLDGAWLSASRMVSTARAEAFERAAQIFRAMAQEPTHVNSACMSYSHDYGLLKPVGREKVAQQAKWWAEAWSKEFDLAIRKASGEGKPHCGESGEG